jgi:hypothetical protein
MRYQNKKYSSLFFLLMIPFLLTAQSIKIVTNHVGYESSKAKQAVIVAGNTVTLDGFQLVNTTDNKVVYTGHSVFTGPVRKWKNWLFWTIDFSAYTTPGTYQLQIEVAGKIITSYPFIIGKKVLEQATLSDVIYYFKGQRSSGLLDKADHTLLLAGKTTDTIDAHGGWYDATGDYGKHLSHLSFSTYFNPQQISLTAWSLLKTYELLHKKSGTDFRQYTRRLLDEAMYGADYLARVHPANGSFYRSVSAPGPGKFAKDRVIPGKERGYSIKKSKDQAAGSSTADDDRSYQASYRSGGGIAIAALAIAATYDTCGDYSNADYLRAAEEAFAFLEQYNASMTNDGKENIVDDYCALAAATELYKATKKTVYKDAADKRALQLMNRLASWKKYHDYWRADDKDRPFFHAADAGFPLVSLISYYPVANSAVQNKIREVVKRSLQFELSITYEVNNPFGYSRQLVQDTAGNRHSAFFFPHGTETAPWWQGENARLGAMASAARMAATLFNDNKALHDSLENFALNQLNWILGLNPFDACMLQGTGHNNPAYGFFGTFEYTNAPGGIVNGITSGLNDEEDIDFNLSYATTGKDYDWRWAEQWLPHAAWYLLAVALVE